MNPSYFSAFVSPESFLTFVLRGPYGAFRSCVSWTIARKRKSPSCRFRFSQVRGASRAVCWRRLSSFLSKIVSKHLAENLEKEKVFFCGNDDRLRHLILLFAPCSSVRDFVKMANVRCQACQAKYRLLAAKRVNLLGLEARPQKPASRFPYRPCSYSSPLFFFFLFSSSFAKGHLLHAGKENAWIAQKLIFPSRPSICRARLAGLRLGVPSRELLFPYSTV